MLYLMKECPKKTSEYVPIGAATAPGWLSCLYMLANWHFSPSYHFKVAAWTVYIATRWTEFAEHVR